MTIRVFRKAGGDQQTGLDAHVSAHTDTGIASGSGISIEILINVATGQRSLAPPTAPA